MPAAEVRVALVSRELGPRGGGIGQYVSATARLLAPVADVTVFTTDANGHAQPEELPDGVEVVYVPEPDEDDLGGFLTVVHAYAARVLDALRQHYGDRGPELVEFSDYLGEGALTAQARRNGDPFLAGTSVAIRLHSTAEICSVLDGHLGGELYPRVIHELERMALRDADWILWPGGEVLATYRRFYGGELAPARCVRNPAPRPPAPAVTEEPRDPAGPVRFLYLGRLERRKGVRELVGAACSIDHPALQLTLLGGDTPTGPLGGSMAAQLDAMRAGDGRITFAEPVAAGALESVIRSHDAVVAPSLWECWPYIGLEALRAGRPLVATPTGGFTEMVRPELSGWLTADTGLDALRSVLVELLLDRPRLERPRLEGTAAAAFAELTDPGPMREAYTELAELPGRWAGRAAVRPRPGRHRHTAGPVAEPLAPLVSAIVPYFRLSAYVTETVESIFAQTHPRMEVVVVNDGSFGEADHVLGELVARFPLRIVHQTNHGLGSARNLGISQSRGRYVVPVDADNAIEPEFVARAVALLEAEPELAYVTAWSRYVDERGDDLHGAVSGYQPFGSRHDLGDLANVCGDALAVLPRRIFSLGFRYREDLTSYEDWQLYRELHAAGRFGTVIPERLIRYRVRGASMLQEVGLSHHERLLGEMAAHRREGEIAWT